MLPVSDWPNTAADVKSMVSSRRMLKLIRRSNSLGCRIEISLLILWAGYLCVFCRFEKISCRRYECPKRDGPMMEHTRPRKNLTLCCKDQSYKTAVTGA